MKKRVLVILALLAAGAAVYWVFQRPRTAAGAGLVLHGNVDIREVNLGFRVPGRIVSVEREEGDAAEAGQMLAKLDAEPYQREIEGAQAQVGALGARVRLLETGYRPQEIAQARAMVQEREVFARNAKRLLDRQQELVKVHAISEQELEDAEARFHEAEARLNSSREQLRLLEAGYRSEEVAQAKAELARSEAALAAARLRLEDTVLKAPSSGTILTRVQEPGAIVQAGATVLTLSVRQPVWVRAYVHEPDLGRIHPGQKVDVFTDSRPHQPYHGQIGYISPRAEFTPKNVETEELRTLLVYRLRIVVDSPDEGLRQGMPVTVRLGVTAPGK